MMNTDPVNTLRLPTFSLGCMRLKDWGYNQQELSYYIRYCIDQGISCIDHADIYGDYECERIFGESLQWSAKEREQVHLVSKCGIKLLSSQFPKRRIKHYDYNKEYIIQQVDQSLTHLKTDYLDVLLLHRPSPLMHLEEIAAAFSALHQSGKVHHFGLSNFTPEQTRALKEICPLPITVNQIEVSPFNHEHLNNDNLHYIAAQKMTAMCWSPLGGGQLFSPVTEQERRVHHTIKDVASHLGTQHLDAIAYAWIQQLPANTNIILGTGKKAHIESALASKDLALSKEQWFSIYVALTGTQVP